MINFEWRLFGQMTKIASGPEFKTRMPLLNAGCRSTQACLYTSCFPERSRLLSRYSISAIDFRAHQGMNFGSQLK
jgi:hypothetical protein